MAPNPTVFFAFRIFSSDRSLIDPRVKMSKSDPSTKGTIFLTDSDDTIARKIHKAWIYTLHQPHQDQSFIFKQQTWWVFSIYLFGGIYFLKLFENSAQEYNEASSGILGAVLFTTFEEIRTRHRVGTAYSS